MADGDIHVYGSLRGRALAGLSGNTSAKVYINRVLLFSSVLVHRPL